MLLKELCATTDCELCIILGSVQCWTEKTKTQRTDKTFIPPHWLDYEVTNIQIDSDAWDVYYLEVFLKTS